MGDQCANRRREEQDSGQHEGEGVEPAPRRANPATVVVADDDDAFRETLLIWLSDTEQWNVREASNGDEALENLDDSVDLLVLDRGMPVLSGSEVVEQLHETPFGGPTMVLSANRPDTSLNEDDVETYLLKPIDRESFLTKVEQCLH